MRALLAIAAAASAALAAPAPAEPQDETAALARIAERGRLLYEVDKAGFEAMEHFLSEVPAATNWPVTGWVAERGAEAGAYTVTFYGAGPAGAPFAGPGGRVAMFESQMKDGTPVAGRKIDPSARPPLSDAQQALARAREAAMVNVNVTAKARPCTSGRFDAVVIPPEQPGGPIDAYMLTPQEGFESLPLGGHYLVRVAADGKVAERRELANGCLNVLRPAEGPVMTANPLGPLPTEIHVFASYANELPVIVWTERQAWLVDRDKITRADAN